MDTTSSTTAERSAPCLVLLTDPMCSWCWGMWPEWLKLQDQLQQAVTFDLLLCGIQVGRPFTAPSDDERHRIGEIWAEVAQVTGQRLSHRLPEDPAFFYHSEIACRAIVAVGKITRQVPFAFLEQLHQAFYIEGINLSSPDALAFQAEIHGIDRMAFLERLRSDEVKLETRRHMAQSHELTGGIMPTVLGKRGDEIQMLSGGYATLEGMWPAVQSWLQTQQN